MRLVIDSNSSLVVAKAVHHDDIAPTEVFEFNVNETGRQRRKQFATQFQVQLSPVRAKSPILGHRLDGDHIFFSSLVHGVIYLADRNFS